MRIPAYVTVFLIAFAARIAAWTYFERQIANTPGREFVVAGDAEGYWDLGSDIAAGRDYAVYTPPRRVLRTPGVPAVIATSITLFGESKTAARALLATLAAFGPVMIYGIGWRVGGRRVGFVAGLLASISPLAVGLSPVLLSDGLFAALLAWQLSIAGPLIGCGPVCGENRPSTLRYLMLGVAAGAAVLVKPAWLPAMPIIAGALWWYSNRLPHEHRATNEQRTERSLRGACLFAIAFAVMLSPWVIRNARVTGHLVPTSLWLGPTLYDSFGLDADGGSNMAFFDNEAEQRIGMSEYDVDRWYRDRAIALIFEKPTRALRLAGSKQLRFWSIWPRADEISSKTIRFAIAGWTVAIFSLAVVALCIAHPSPQAILLTIGPLAYFALLHLIFVGSMRYRMPAELPLCVLAALPLAAKASSVKARELPADNE